MAKRFNTETDYQRHDTFYSPGGGSIRKGINSVGAYQISGHPFVTGSTDLDDGKVHRVSFPYVSKSFTVINNNTGNGEDIRVHFQSGSSVSAFTQDGVYGAQNIAAADDVIAGLHFITVPSGYSSMTFDVKCKEFFISNGSGNDDLGYQVLAELTMVETRKMYVLT
jgi:hypothetical protein